MKRISEAEWTTALAFIEDRKRAYQMVFGDVERNAMQKAVIDDLAKFCRADETCFRTDAREHAELEGRREVWLRVQQHLNLSPEELAILYSGGDFLVEKDSA